MAEELRYPIEVNIPDGIILDIDIIHEEYDKIQRMIEKIDRRVIRTVLNEQGVLVTIRGSLSPIQKVKLNKLHAEFHKMTIEQAKWIRNQLANEDDAWEIMTDLIEVMIMSYQEAVEKFNFSFC